MFRNCRHLLQWQVTLWLQAMGVVLEIPASAVKSVFERFRVKPTEKGTGWYEIPHNAFDAVYGEFNKRPLPKNVPEGKRMVALDFHKFERFGLAKIDDFVDEHKEAAYEMLRDQMAGRDKKGTEMATASEFGSMVPDLAEGIVRGASNLKDLKRWAAYANKKLSYIEGRLGDEMFDYAVKKLKKR